MTMLTGTYYRVQGALIRIADPSIVDDLRRALGPDSIAVVGPDELIKGCVGNIDRFVVKTSPEYQNELLYTKSQYMALPPKLNEPWYGKFNKKKRK